MKGGPEGCSKFLLDLRRKVNMAGNESGTRMWGYGCGRPEEAIGEAKGVGQEEKREMRPATRSGRSMCMRRGDGGSERKAVCGRDEQGECQRAPGRQPTSPLFPTSRASPLSSMYLFGSSLFQPRLKLRFNPVFLRPGPSRSPTPRTTCQD